MLRQNNTQGANGIGADVARRMGRAFLSAGCWEDAFQTIRNQGEPESLSAALGSICEPFFLSGVPFTPPPSLELLLRTMKTGTTLAILATLYAEVLLR